MSNQITPFRTLASFLLLFIILVNPGSATGQFHSHVPDIGLKYPIPFPRNYPPINKSMPLDVLLGYIYSDSIARNLDVPSGQVDSVIFRLCYSDTLKYALKYLYEMIDFDPVSFCQFLSRPKTSTYRRHSPNACIQSLFGRAAAVCPDSGVTSWLCKVSAIMDITVTDTTTIIDPARTSLNKLGIVQATINDIIKGQSMPSCDFSHLAEKGENRPLAGIGGCLNFEYQLNWQSEINAPGFVYNPATLYDSAAGTWVKKGSEYIALLDLRVVGYDSTRDYATIMPDQGVSTVLGMYPVRAGIVFDPNSDFKFGTGLTLVDFKTALRGKIFTIVHPQ
jgi:hypothetical protein